MKIPPGTPQAMDWSAVPVSEHPGLSGTALVQSCAIGDMQVRLISYSSEYVADHWCRKGHIVMVLDGSLVIEHQDGDPIALNKGMSYLVGDDGASHRLLSVPGAKIFVVD
jgi:hypothetical protein